MPFHVYIMTNERRTVLYTGMTNDLPRRVFEHRERRTEGSTRQYNVTLLVYFEECGDAAAAIEREKQLKAGSRAKKVSLIERANPEWSDLYPMLTQEP